VKKSYQTVVQFFLGVFLIAGSTSLSFFDFGTGDTFSSGGNLFSVYIIVSYIAAFLLISLVVNKKGNSFAYAVAYPVLLVFILHIYSNVYLLPKIDSDGILVKGIVSSKQKRASPTGGTPNMIRNYEYTVNNRKYFKYTYNENINVGDTILVKYLARNPHLHRYYIIEFN
jgi:hypothetical protein